MTDSEALAILKANFQALPARDQEFGSSLVHQAARRPLSSKQWYWVRVLAERASAVEEPKPTETVGNSFAGVVALFSKASTKLQRPAIVLELPDRAPVRIWPAKPNSRNPGSIYVRVDGEYVGKVAQDGTFSAGYALKSHQREPLLDLLRRLADDPAGTAAAYGKRTGGCCFCNISLTDERSLEVGYGPVCAKHYGLPWGSTASAVPALLAHMAA